MGRGTGLRWRRIPRLDLVVSVCNLWALDLRISRNYDSIDRGYDDHTVQCFEYSPFLL